MKKTTKKTNVAAELKADLNAGKKAAELTAAAQTTDARRTELRGADYTPNQIEEILKAETKTGRKVRNATMGAKKETPASATPAPVSATTGKPLSKRDLKSLAKKAAIEAAANKPKAEKPAKKVKTPKAPKPASTDLSIRLYGAGKVFIFGKLAAERINGMPNMKVTIDGKKITMIATKSSADTAPITEHQGRPILRAGKILRDVEWSGDSQTLIAKPVNSHGFEFVLDAKGAK